VGKVPGGRRGRRNMEAKDLAAKKDHEALSKPGGKRSRRTEKEGERKTKTEGRRTGIRIPRKSYKKKRLKKTPGDEKEKETGKVN